MGAIDIIIIIAIALAVGGALAYIIKEKKSGKRCIGCPDSVSCQKNKKWCGGSCPSCGGCHTEDKR